PRRGWGGCAPARANSPRTAGHAPKLTFVVRHERGADPTCVCGNQQIVSADRLSLGQEGCFDLPEVLRGVARKVIRLKHVQDIVQCAFVLVPEFPVLYSKMDFR